MAKLWLHLILGILISRNHLCVLFRLKDSGRSVLVLQNSMPSSFRIPCGLYCRAIRIRMKHRTHGKFLDAHHHFVSEASWWTIFEDLDVMIYCPLHYPCLHRFYYFCFNILLKPFFSPRRKKIIKYCKSCFYPFLTLITNDINKFKK